MRTIMTEERREFLDNCHLRQLRIKAGVKYDDFKKNLVWSKNNYQKYENQTCDINKASVYQIRELARLFGVNMSDIVTDPELVDFLKKLESSQPSWKVQK